MSEKIIKVYDGNGFKDILCKEIEGAPGHFLRIEETQKTFLGTYLDNEQNRINLEKDLNNFNSSGFNTSPYSITLDYNYIFTDDKDHRYLLSRSTRWNADPAAKFKSLYEAVIDRISSLGYVNKPYEKKTDTDPFEIIFYITPKSANSDIIEMHLRPMDNDCYKFS